MKKLLFSLSLLATLASVAGESTIEADAQVFGVLPITSSAADVIVSVPWVESGYTNGNIAVSNIIKTANLTEGDSIRIWNSANTNFNAWVLTKNPSTQVLYWQITKTISPKGETESTDSSQTYLKRGEALILHRNNPTTDNVANTFYVYGQYTTAAADPISIVAGAVKTNSYTLVAHPGTAALDLNDTTQIGFTGTVKNGATYDNIVYGESTANGRTYYRKSDPKKDGSGPRWGYTSKSGWVDAETIPAGVGFWYVSRGGSPTITFK